MERTVPDPALAAAFISYSREDSEFVLRLAKDLKGAGGQVWLDQLDSHPGHPWDVAIEGALNRAPQMLLVLSPASTPSRRRAGASLLPLGLRDAIARATQQQAFNH